GAPVTIVGGAAAGFGGTMTGQHVEAWAPLPMVVATRVASASAFATDPKLAIYSVVARLAPDVTAAAAQRGLGSDSLQVVRSFGRDPDLRRDDAHYFLLLGSAVGLLLLLICANVAALSLLRTASRRHEFATRLALGASRAALARQVLVEAALLAVAATLLGGSTAALFVQHSSAVASQFGQVAFGVDGTVLSFAAAACAVTLIAVSVVPIARLGGVDPMTVLRSATAGRGRRVSPAQRGLVALQVAVSLVLVATASMIFRTFQRSLHSDPGFEPRGVGMVYFDPRVQGLDSVRTLAVLRELERATTANPEFASAAVATAAPLLGRGGTFTVFRDGEVPPVGASRGAHRGVPVRHAAVSPSYFATLRIPVIAGRTIGYDDGPGAGRVAVVSRHLAERMWGTHSAVGKYLEWPRRTGPPARMLVVGVVGDVKQSSLMDASEPMLYVSITQWPPDGTLLIARGRLGEAPMAALKRVLASVRPALDLDGTWTMSELVRQSVETQRIVSFWVGVAGLLAMVLSALGVYGVVAQVVRERMRELAVRCALGARPGQLVTVLMTEGLLLAGLGGVAGTVALVWTQSVVRRSLDGMAGVDPLVVAACVVLLGLAMALASYLPARRAAAVNPIDVLRQE
ncbi:MAG: FtsX-like permease family protein, partial [Gemmatimonadaceae bacterium]